MFNRCSGSWFGLSSLSNQLSASIALVTFRLSFSRLRVADIRATAIRATALGLFILITLPHAADNAPAPLQIKDYVLEGNKFYQNEDFEEAAGMYREAVKNNQNLPFAWFNLGNCYAQKKNYPRAIVCYRRSVEAAPQFTRPWLILGDIYFSMNAVGDAMVCYRRVVELEPDNVYAWKWRGECALKAGGTTEAMRSFDAALKLDPDQIDVYFALAECHAQIRDYEAAQGVMEDAILLSPKVTASVYFYLGYLFEQSGQYKKAVRAYEEGLLLKPRDVEMYLRIARIYRETDSDFLALLCLEGAQRSGIHDARINLERGSIFFAQERLDRAQEEYVKALALGNSRGRYGIENVSSAWWNKGEKEKAREVLELLR